MSLICFEEARRGISELNNLKDFGAIRDEEHTAEKRANLKLGRITGIRNRETGLLSLNRKGEQWRLVARRKATPYFLSSKRKY